VVWIGFIWLSGLEPMVGFCEHGNEPSGSVQCAEFIGYLSNY